MTERLPAIVPWQTLGTLLELEKSTVAEYAQEGVFVKAGRNQYLLAPSVRNYVRKLREIAAGRAGDQLNAVDENARLKIVQRKNYELKNAALEGALVSTADLTEAWGEIVRTIKAMVLSIPARCQQDLPHLQFEDFEGIRVVIHKVLTEMAGVMPDNPPTECDRSRLNSAGQAQSRASARAQHVAPSLI